MTAAERGFLLLTSHLGDPERKVLTVPQFRLLAQCVRGFEFDGKDRDLSEEDLMAMGYNRPSARRIVSLLWEEDRLKLYLREAAQFGCLPISRISGAYPPALRKRLALDSPGCLWAKGDVRLLNTPMVSLVGSRDLNGPNREFAEAVGANAARQGYTLVSGNARGADTAAQEAALAAGGKVICVVADALFPQPKRENVLYLAEDSFDMPFSAQRALSRNRIIHSLGRCVFVAQCRAGSGGTWDGTQKNLHNQWSPVFCYDDGSEGIRMLSQMGATLIGSHNLSDFSKL